MWSKFKILAFLIAVQVLLVACTAADTNTNTDTVSSPIPNTNLAQGIELTGIQAWLNSEELSIQEELNNNRVVLIDFWTYTCVNCIRTLPFISEWYGKYKDKGLTIIGVHSPEFEFEKDTEGIRNAANELGVTWAIANDSEMKTWNAFGNRYWPAKYLIVPGSGIVYSQFGEGNYRTTELEIRHALSELGYEIDDIPLGEVQNKPFDTTTQTRTREIYTGYARNFSPNGLYSGQRSYFDSVDAPIEFEDDGEYMNERFYLQGTWTNKIESVLHSRTTQNLEDYILVPIQARSANVVLNSVDGSSYRVYVQMNDMPIAQADAGEDIKYDTQGNSYFDYDKPRLYKVLEAVQYTEANLKMSSNSEQWEIYAFTFGLYEEGF